MPGHMSAAQKEKIARGVRAYHARCRSALGGAAKKARPKKGGGGGKKKKGKLMANFKVRMLPDGRRLIMKN